MSEKKTLKVVSMGSSMMRSAVCPIETEYMLDKGNKDVTDYPMRDTLRGEVSEGKKTALLGDWCVKL